MHPLQNNVHYLLNVHLLTLVGEIPAVPDGLPTNMQGLIDKIDRVCNDLPRRNASQYDSRKDLFVRLGTRYLMFSAAGKNGFASAATLILPQHWFCRNTTNITIIRTSHCCERPSCTSATFSVSIVDFNFFIIDGTLKEIQKQTRLFLSLFYLEYRDLYHAHHHHQHHSILKNWIFLSSSIIQSYLFARRRALDFVAPDDSIHQ